MQFSLRHPGVAYIANVTVDPEYRRRGVGRALVAAAEEEALSAGGGELRSAALHANAGDRGARALYDGSGYEVVAEDPLFLAALPGRTRRVLMQKALR